MKLLAHLKDVESEDKFPSEVHVEVFQENANQLKLRICNDTPDRASKTYCVLALDLFYKKVQLIIDTDDDDVTTVPLFDLE